MPDKLEATLDKTYQPGETAKLFIKAPFVGEVELAIASDRVLSLRALSLPAGGATLDIPVDPHGAAAFTRWSARTARRTHLARSSAALAGLSGSPGSGSTAAPAR